MRDKQVSRHFQYLITRDGDNHRGYGNIESEYLTLSLWMMDVISGMRRQVGIRSREENEDILDKGQHVKSPET